MLELYVTIAQLFRRLGDLEAPDISAEDFVYEDYFLAVYPAHAWKFRIRRKGLLMVQRAIDLNYDQTWPTKQFIETSFRLPKKFCPDSGRRGRRDTFLPI